MGEIYGGVETGGTWVVCALGHRTGRDRARRRRSPPASRSATLERIVAFFERRTAPAAIGIGSFGPVDLDRDSPDLGPRDHHPQAGLGATRRSRPVLRDRLGVPVAFDTDVTAAAVGEQRWGAARASTASATSPSAPGSAPAC